ncbi:MAG: hypothetical protein ACJ779_09370 [Chloroflexota bacterium]
MGSHPNLGLAPRDPTAGLPDAAARVRANVERLAARALRVGMDLDPTIQTRYDEAGQRHLLRDAELLAEQVAVCLEGGDPEHAREYAEWTVPVYRRRFVPMDDLITLCNGLRGALPSVLAPGELAPAGAALDEAIAGYKWHRRLAGDARKRNRFLQLLYKGA